MGGSQENDATGPRDASATRTTAGTKGAAGTATFVPGEVVAGRFRITRFIAQGGMGEVYEARDLELGEDVAVKTIRHDIAGDANAAERFKTEIHLARRVTHPNACRIYDVFHHRPPGAGPESETLLLSMELLKGETLAERLRREGRMTPSQALPLLSQMAAALDAAHHAGVVHRDFKSGNVVLSPEAAAPERVRVVVTDFGLARRVAADEASMPSQPPTQSLLVGTPAYMAPEQVEGGPVTPSADIYALGVVLYEMLTGERPFDAETPLAALIKRLKEPPRPPRHFVSDLDPRWEAVILRCLERDPADRFASAQDVVRALAGDRVTGSLGRQALRRRRRVLLAGGAVLVMTLAAGWALERLRPRPPASAPQERAIPVGVAPRRAVAVLGFRNLSGREETAWLSTAFSEMLGSELAAGEALRIVAGETVARMKLELALEEADALAADSLARVRRHLGADLLVMGSYAMLGGKIRLDLRLQDASAGETIASLSETGVEAELFELVSRMGARLRGKLGAAPLSQRQADGVRASLPSDPEAARLYAEGLVRLRIGDALGARGLLERAVGIEPGHALIHSALAAAWSGLGYESSAAKAARRAFELAAPLSREERLAVEGRYRETARDWDQAIEIYGSLVRFFPDNLDYALRLASAQTSAGKGQDALGTFEALRRLPAPAGEDPRIDLAEALAARLLSQSERSVDAARRAAAKAEALGARRLLARAHFDEGSALQNLGEFDKAQAALERSRRMFAEAEDPNGVAGALNNLSLIVANRGDLKLSRQLCEEALALYRAIGKKSGEALMLGNVGNLHYFEGDFEGARRMWERTLVTYREINEKDGVARMLTNIASVTAEQGDPSRALASYEQALEVWRDVGQRSGEAATLHDIGKARHQLGDLAGAERAYRESLAIFGQIGDKTYAASALHDQADLLLCKGDLAGARRGYQEALDMREGMGEKVSAGLTRIALAELDLEEGRPAQAEQVSRQVADQFQTEKNADAEASARLTLARSLLALGRVTEGRMEARRAADLAERGQNRTLKIAAAVGLVRLGAERGAPDPLRRLRALLAEKGKTTPVAMTLEARLAETERAAPQDPAAAVETLGRLEADARAKGFALLAGKAAAARARLAPTDRSSLR